MARILIELSDEDEGVVNVLVHPYETPRSVGEELIATPAEDMVAEMLLAVGIDAESLFVMGTVQ